MSIFFQSIEELQFSQKKIAVITDDNVERLYGDRILSHLRYKEAALFSFTNGEKYKNRAAKEEIENAMMEKGYGKDCLIIGLGGGVVTDLAGFIASTFCRGVPLVLLPTTLTAMVDAAIGGKNGINTPFGKNLIGTIYFAERTVIDSSFLSSLPLHELRNGLVEMLKHGLVADEAFFNFLVNNAEDIWEKNILQEAIERGIAIKQAIVQKDPNEAGLRRILNFGHTIGHAIEQNLEFTISHGEAVALGILAESRLSAALKFLPEKQSEAIMDGLDRLQLPIRTDLRLDVEKLESAMALDKKSSLGAPRFVLLESIGKAKSFDGQYCQTVDAKVLRETLTWLFDALRSR